MNASIIKVYGASSIAEKLRVNKKSECCNSVLQPNVITWCYDSISRPGIIWPLYNSNTAHNNVTV